MSLQFALIVLLWIVGASALALLALVWHRGHARRKPWLALLALASALYAFGYGLELAGSTVDWVFATYRIQHLAIAFAPTILLLIAADLGELPRLASPRVLALASAISVATIAVVYTNPLHELFHVDARMDTSGPLALVTFDTGPWYVGFHVYVALVLVTANVAFLRAWWRAAPQSRQRAQTSTVALASLLPWLGSLVYVFGILPLPIDTTPIALVFTCFLIYRGVTHHALADVSPIARDLVFERMHDPVLVLDTDGRVVDHNEAAGALLADGAAQWLGRTPHEVLGRDVTEIAPPDGGGDTVVDAAPLEIGGRTFDTRLAQLRDRGGRSLGRALVLRDVTDHAQALTMLAHLASTDELTGISNRRHFLGLTGRVLERAHRDGQPTSLIIFDLDSFKQVNDSHGHLVGDALLRAVAASVAGNLRPTDLLGRYGGEEFAVCLPETGAADAFAAAERLRVAVRATTSIHDAQAVSVSASVGVSTTDPHHDDDLEALLQRADAAQYEAKRRGGNAVVAAPPPADTSTLAAAALD